MISAIQISQSIDRFSKPIHLIYDGMNLFILEKCQHLLESVLWTIKDAFQCHISLQRQNIGMWSTLRMFVLLSTKVSDGADQPSHPHTLEAFVQGISAPSLKDDIGPLVLGQS